LKLKLTLLFCLVGMIAWGQSDSVQLKTDKKPVYKCKEFTLDTAAHKITFKKETLYWIFDENKNIVKKGWGKTVDIYNLQKWGTYYYLFMRKGNKETPTEDEIKEKAYLIKV